MTKERFVETYSQGVTNVRKIIVDTETGVNYLLISSNMTTGCGIAFLSIKMESPLLRLLTRKISNFNRVDSRGATGKRVLPPRTIIREGEFP